MSGQGAGDKHGHSKSNNFRARRVAPDFSSPYLCTCVLIVESETPLRNSSNFFIRQPLSEKLHNVNFSCSKGQRWVSNEFASEIS